MKKNISINNKTKYTDTENYQKHFNLDDRIKIQKIISEHRNDEGKLTIMLKDIGEMLQNDPSTISKEVKLRRVLKERPVYYRYSNINSICKKFSNCTLRMNNSNKFLKAYSNCVNHCKDFEENICPHLKRFPWVCNGCPKTGSCRLNKYFYYSDIAQKDYETTLISSREGINITEHDFKELDHIVSSSIKDNGQPIAHIIRSNDLPVSERTIYNYFEKGYFTARNIDLRRKVTYKKRHETRISSKIMKKIRFGRTYENYLDLINSNNNLSIVQMDTVEGLKDEDGFLLTLHFVKYNFQLAKYIEKKDSEHVTNAINDICNVIGIDMFKKMFEVILTDNGAEFSDPDAIEVDPNTGEIRSKVFFCDAYSSYQKGACEKNHEYIRYIIPKKASFAKLTQDKVDLMMSHINSTIRPEFNACPYDFMALAFGKEVLSKLKIKKIDSKLVKLTPNLIK